MWRFARVRNPAHLVRDDIDSFLAGRGPLPKETLEKDGIRHDQLIMQDHRSRRQLGDTPDMNSARSTSSSPRRACGTPGPRTAVDG